MNLATILTAAARSAPDAPALRTESGVRTHVDVADHSARLAAHLAGVVEPGDRVAIVAGNEPEFVDAYLAVLSVGAVAVPLEPAAPAAELAAQIDRVDASLVVASAAHAPRAAEAAGLVSPGRDLLVVDAELTSSIAGLDPRSPVDVPPRHPAVLLFTSGTAGPPRAATLTHGCIAANLGQIQGHPDFALRADDVALGLLPFFHVYGLDVVLGVSLAAGASVVLVAHFDPVASLQTVRSAGVTVVTAVPAVYAAWLAVSADDAPADTFAGVRLAVSGAAPLPDEVAAGMQDRFGVVVAEGYGLTEASPVVTTAAGAPSPRRGSVGPPLPGVEVRLVDHDGRDVLAGDPGEIWVRGPNVFAGYWGDDEATAAVLDDDAWLHTGDVAIADDDGWLRLVGRTKDLVIVSGFNVYPAEVEEALTDLPEIAAAAVVGEPDDRTGERVVAYVVASDGAVIDPDDLVASLSARLARYKLPTRVVVVDDLPRTAAGKLLRRELRDDATANPA